MKKHLKKDKTMPLLKWVETRFGEVAGDSLIWLGIIGFFAVLIYVWFLAKDFFMGL